MACAIDTTLDLILLAIKSQIQTSAGFGDNTCYIGLNPEENIFQASDDYAVITPTPQKIAMPYVEGTNPGTLVFQGSVEVTVWTRLALDQAPRDDSYLTDANLGTIPVVTKVIQALHLFTPVDSNGNALTMKKMMVESIEKFQRNFNGVGWGATKLSFSILWRMALS